MPINAKSVPTLALQYADRCNAMQYTLQSKITVTCEQLVDQSRGVAMAGAGHQLTLVAHSPCTECHWWHLHTSDGALGPVVYWWPIYHCSWCIGTLGMDKRTLLIVQSSLLFTQNISVHLCFQGGVCCAFVCSSLSDQKLQVTSFQLGKYQLCWTQCVLSEDITNIKSSGQPVRYMQILTFDWRVGPKICNPIEWSLDLLLLHIKY